MDTVDTKLGVSWDTQQHLVFVDPLRIQFVNLLHNLHANLHVEWQPQMCQVDTRQHLACSVPGSLIALSSPNQCFASGCSGIEGWWEGYACSD